MSVPVRMVALVAVQAVVGLSAAGCVDISAGNAQYVESVEKRFAVTGAPTLKVGTFDGRVDVSAWDRPEVLVTIEKHAASKADADRIEVTAEQHGDEIEVQVRRERDGGFHLDFGSTGARITVNVPAKARVEASTGDGRVSVRGVEGDLAVRTGDGSIHLDNVNGAVSAASGDGSIEVNGVVRELKVRSGDGRVRVRAEGPGPTADWSLATGDGSVVLEVPEGFNADLDAATGDGSVNVSDVPFSGTSSERQRRVARGRIGNGGPTITIRSGDGGITVRRSSDSPEL
jgi:hypothetical protein